MNKLIKSILLLNSLLLASICYGQEPAQTDEKAIISWIRENAVPIRHVEAGHPYEDLQPLKEILKGVRVVGLGEATHGTREFFQIKHRLLEFLVKEMGYTGFAMEAPFFACKPINDYILSGKGDLATVLTGQGYVVWDTEEMAQMIGWMRTYNQNVPEERQVKFYGVDLAYQEIGRKEVLDFLEKVAPDKKSPTDSIFQILAKEEEKWPMQKDSLFEKTLLQTLPSLQNVMDDLIFHKEMFVQKSSLKEFDQIYQDLRVMKQFILANTPSLFPPFMDGANVRSLAMAENLVYLMDQAGPDAKFVIWEHNTHIAKDVWKGSTFMGYQLRKKYGEGYYAFGLEFNQGSFHTRLSLPDNLLGDLKAVSLPPAPVGTLPWYLSRSDIGNLILNLRHSLDNPLGGQWIQGPHQMYLASWVYAPDSDYITPLEVSKLYDGILFIDRTTPTHPTSNAIKTTARREGL